MQQDARNSFRVEQAPYWCHRAVTPIWLDDPGVDPGFYETCWHIHVFNCGTENRLRRSPIQRLEWPNTVRPLLFAIDAEVTAEHARLGARYRMEDGQIEIDSIEPIGLPDG
jgi:hypothetical protein